MPKDDSNQDEKSAIQAQEEAKESSQLGYFSRLKLAYNLFAAALKSREGERAAMQSFRPIKDSPVDPMAVGAGLDLRGDANPTLATVVTTNTTGDEGDGDAQSGDGGSSGTGSTSGGSSSGGGPTPAPDAGYVSFAESAVETKADVKTKAIQNVLSAPEQKTDGGQGPGKKMQEGPKTQKSTIAPAAPKGASTGPGAGGKGGAAPTP